MSDNQPRSPQRKLQENIRQVRGRIAEACGRAGRDPQTVRLIAVTKTIEVDMIRLAIDCGLTDLGENRVQELCRRASMVTETVRRKRRLGGEEQTTSPTWHMIGHLQRNKVRKVLEWTNIIHSVDSLRLAEEISKTAAKLDRTVDIMLEVNLAGEKSKYGLAVGAVDVVVQQIVDMPGVRLRGLMNMAPWADDPAEVRADFARLRELSEDLRERELVGASFTELSMGMTNDFEVAIEEGATMLRIGSALFEGLVPATVDA